MVKYKKIETPFYLQEVHIFVCDDAETDIEELGKKVEISFERYDFAGLTEQRGKNHILIFNLKYLTDKIFQLSTIAHEAFHCSNTIMKRVGIKPDVDNDEAQAYLLSWLVEQILKVIKSKK